MRRILSFLSAFTKAPAKRSILTAALLLAIAVGALLAHRAGLPPFAPPAATREARTPAPAAFQALPDTAFAVRETIVKDVPQFEEALGSPLEELLKRVDHAVLESLLLSGLEPGHLRIQDMTPSTDFPQTERDGRHFQRVMVQAETPPESFFRILDSELRRLDDEARLEQQNATAWLVRLRGAPTHELLFLPPAATPEPLPPGEGVLVVVMDDLGLDARFARELAALSTPVSFSVLPWLPHTEEVAAIAREHGRELLLHQPMEPMDASVSPGPGALFVGMPTQRIKRLVRENLQKVPGAQGLNNHMGSRITQDATAMDAVLDVASEQGLFVIDSLTHPKSKLASRARERGVPVLRRDVFLDVVRATESILYQLRKAESIARNKGAALAIGHPYPETLRALRRWSMEREFADHGVPVVSASALVRARQNELARNAQNERNSPTAPLARNSISR